MDNLTHSLVGALLGQAGLKRRTGLAMPALIIGANLPDIDATCTIYGIESLAMRRGLTHGPIAWVLLPLMLAGALWWFDRWQAKRGKRPEARLPVRFGWLYALAFIACLTHPALDWLNSYGIRLIEPFSHRWFYGDALFIVDPWLWAGMGVALWFSLRRERRGGSWRGPAVAGIAGALAYIGLNLAITQHYESAARSGPSSPRIVIANPVPLAFWRRQMITGGVIGLAGRDYVFREVQWTVDGHRYGVRLPREAVEEMAGDDPSARAFMFWSRAPFLEGPDPYGFDGTRDSGCVIRDARFATSAGGSRFSIHVPEDACISFFE